MNYAAPIIDKYNAIAGSLVAVLSYFLGEHWMLFAAFLLLNVADFITGGIKSRLSGTVSSQKGYKGVIKKFGYWIIIMVSFLMCDILLEIGETIDVDLQITVFLGWFVLATFIINEIRSILENLVEAGIHVPTPLIKGLEVANKALDGVLKVDTSDPDIDKYRLVVNEPLEKLKEKTKVTFSVEDEHKK